MAVFANTEKMYEVLGSLFETLLKDPTAGPKFVESDIVIKFDPASIEKCNFLVK